MPFYSSVSAFLAFSHWFENDHRRGKSAQSTNGRFTRFQISGCSLWGGGGRQPDGGHVNISVRQQHRVVVRGLSSGGSMSEYWAVAPVAYCVVMLWIVAVYICALLTFHPYWPLTFIAWFMCVWHVSASIFDCKIYIKYININIYIGIYIEIITKIDRKIDEEEEAGGERRAAAWEEVDE